MRMLLFVIVGFISGCSGSGASSGGVAGINLTGYYDEPIVECYQSVSPFALTKSVRLFGSGSMKIEGNSLTQNLWDSNCTVEIKSTITFNSDDTYNLGVATVSSATGGSCAVDYSVDSQTGSGGNVTGFPSSTIYSVGQTFPADWNAYVYAESTKAIGIFIVGATTSGSSPADLCYSVYSN